MKRFQLLKYAPLLLLMSVAACSPKVSNRGYVADNEWKNDVKVGQSTRDDVLLALGSPSSRSTFGPETWYYISSRKETVAFLKPEVVKQDVLRIEFDEAGLVKTAEKYDESNRQDVKTVGRTTPTEGHELGFFEQLLGNIGRFNKSANESSAPGRKPGR